MTKQTNNIEETAEETATNYNKGRKMHPSSGIIHTLIYSDESSKVHFQELANGKVLVAFSQVEGTLEMAKDVARNIWKKTLKNNDWQIAK